MQRAIVYGFAWLMVLSVLRAVMNVVLLTEVPTYNARSLIRMAAFPVYEHNPLVCLLCAYAWIAVWWLCALRRGWRMHLALLIWLLVGVAAFLLSLVLAEAVATEPVLPDLIRMVSVIGW